MSRYNAVGVTMMTDTQAHFAKVGIYAVSGGACAILAVFFIQQWLWTLALTCACGLWFAAAFTAARG